MASDLLGRLLRVRAGPPTAEGAGPSSAGRSPGATEGTAEATLYIQRRAGETIAKVREHETAPDRTFEVALLVAIGLVVVAAGDAHARGGNQTPGLFLTWLGLAIQYTATAVRLLNPAVGRNERLRLVCLLGVCLLLSHQFAELWQFNQFDELLHLRSLHDLEATGSLFTPNPLLPISPRFPGLELVTDAVVQLTHLPDQAAALVVLAGARVLLCLGLFLLTELLTGSAYAGGVSVALYAASPQFYFFNSQFAYQTLALGLTLALWVLVAAVVDRPKLDKRTVVVMAVVTAGALALTHHVTSWLAVAYLAVAAMLTIRKRGSIGRRHLLIASAGGLLVVGLWAAFNARTLGGYLVPVVQQAVDQLTSIVMGDSGTRTMGQDGGGDRTPRWEQLVMLASFGMWTATLLPLPPFRGRPLAASGRRAMFSVLRMLQMIYPVTLLGLVSPRAAELVTRLSTFTFLGVAIVIGYKLSVYLAGRPARFRWTALGLVLIAFFGGLLFGSGPDWARVPGRYLVSADGRSIDQHSVAMARWASTNLPADARFAADREAGDVLAATGRQWVVSSLGSGVNAGPVYFASSFGANERRILAMGRIAYFVVDERMTEGLPHESIYIEPGESNPNTRLTRAMLDKFDQTPGCVRIYDSGSIRVYDVRRLWAPGVAPVTASS